MYQWKWWQDHVTQYENRYRRTQNPDGTENIVPEEGEVIQQGTPQNATNFNHLEDGVSNAGELSALMALEIIHQRQMTADLKGEAIEVQLTNNQKYPFNNSVKTVALSQNRNHVKYTVEAEVMEKSGGFVGDIVVTDKLVNGFKIAYTGSATSAKLKVFVKGGFY